MVPDKLLLTTPNPIEERLEALREFFPEAFKEGKLDLETFKQLLGEKVETGRERYGLSWAGKAEAIRAVQIPSSGTLRPRRDQSVGFDTSENVIIEGDNLEVLKLLQQAYHGKVKLIYIDPPYNTGNDFVYPDDFREGVRQYLRFTGQLSEDGVRLTTAPEEGGRIHSRWLSMMYPRLQLARSLLRDDGVIFVSIDDHELHNLRAIMDEIFGEENFLATVLWQKKYAPSNDTTDFSYTHDYLLSYVKSRRFNEQGKAVATLKRMERTEEQNRLYKNPDNDPRGPWMSDNYTCNKTSEQRPNLYYPIIHPKTGKEIWPSRTAVWRYSRERHEQNVREGRVWWGLNQENETPRYKRYLSEVAGVVADTWWEHTDVGHTDEAKKEFKSLFGEDADAFDTPKPVRLLKRLLQLSTEPDAGDIVLDFFAGSGTLGQAVLEMNQEDGGNRRFVLVQLPEPTRNPNYPTISSVTRGRVQKAAERIRSGDEKSAVRLLEPDGQDLGFRAFSLDTSNFKLWDGEAEDIQGQLEALVDNLVEGRTQEDVLFELLLKAGLPLSSRIQKKELEGQKVYSVAEGQLLVCLERPIRAETLRAMMALEPKPLQVVCLDVAFVGGDALKTNIALEMRDRGIRFRTV
ncbi:Site-specific DNA-methyltransferase (adenine-specific) [Allomeiothermus silvanus DSM 9946]|uniref:Site-specific DNA-methyltransferase (Adenine-specific) n=1 Tax=Allomeiothermus silvanus (strain ATCC 700542 / DSM 9946 / NBRC 106475 / NCIMB 13440 / VI-R2) TaxID=526227 RepID=D7BAH4_ALLS1|nr:site-specific DNA-methyltransferase [Allomeiothermus silvanus]ADH62496.1 Site-specific DNA-methyltransferase (adenine-specific) [Allomeiothermus silvanus DSM 9946]